MNDFVNYLNSTNNAGSDTTGSLAEAQVKSTYYAHMQINRKLGSYIADGIATGRREAFILTGHAGDGKTSILVQVLKQAGLLKNGQGMEKEKEYPTFYYVKDMSEIREDERLSVLQKALHAPAEGKSSLLISNTGPLLQSLLAIAENNRKQQNLPFSTAEKIALQSKLLKQLDENQQDAFTWEGYTFYLINIARVDNVGFATQILQNMIAPELWTPCTTCAHHAQCPIYHNRCYLSQQYHRVSTFIDKYYRYLFENDKRMTIRQMMGQLSYGLTGNLTCDKIATTHYKAPIFDYNFANLFFGYRGLRVDKNALQIKGIATIQGLGLDKIALINDYDLFVSGDDSMFTPDVQKELQDVKKTHRQYYKVETTDATILRRLQQHEYAFRCAVRRFYLLYSNPAQEDQIPALYNQIFGTHFTAYTHLIQGNSNKSEIRAMRDMIFKALYIRNTGTTLQNAQDDLPLTVRREGDVFQNVMLVVGSVSKRDFELQLQKTSNRFSEQGTTYHLVLHCKKDTYRVTLPLLTYFDGLLHGAITPNQNPALTHGISALDAMLLDNYGEKRPDIEEDCELHLLVNTIAGQEKMQFLFEDGMVHIE